MLELLIPFQPYDIRGHILNYKDGAPFSTNTCSVFILKVGKYILKV